MRIILDAIGIALFIWIYAKSGLWVAIAWTMVFFMLQFVLLTMVYKQFDTMQFLKTTAIMAVGWFLLKKG